MGICAILLDEVEIDQAIAEQDEITDINPDSEIKRTLPEQVFYSANFYAGAYQYFAAGCEFNLRYSPIFITPVTGENMNHFPKTDMQVTVTVEYGATKAIIPTSSLYEATQGVLTRMASRHGYELVTGTVKSRVRNLVPLRTCRVERLMHVKSAEVQSPPVGMVLKVRRGVPAQVSFSSLDLSSKLLGPSPIFFVLLHSVTYIKIK
ncbi:hypothetical protein TNCV_1734741 [Trichonephila clavipes]|nr:hypothetical protein TNCV_1734741 [Trichonephila clavipes]